MDDEGDVKVAGGCCICVCCSCLMYAVIGILIYLMVR